MKFRKTSLLGVAFILALVSCKKDDDLVASHAPEVTTGSVTNISDTTSTVYGDINSVGSSEISKHGHCWSTSSNPTINNNKTNLGNANAAGSYNSSVTGLSPNTTYYIRAYATNSFGTSYGTNISFTTITGSMPSVTTGATSNITISSSDISGNITDLGNASVTEHGHCWSTSSNPTINNNKTTLGNANATGSYNSSVTGLSPNTTYYIRAYATNSYGTSYGTNISFTTISGMPSVTTGATSNITISSSDIFGNITDLGNASVTEHGHCWSTSSNPTINSNKTNLGNANATGSYNSSVTGLSPNTTYYIRAYATNSYGTSYGNEVVFNTPNQPIAEFSVANTDINVGESIYFLDLSQNNPTNWTWIANGAVPSSSISQNPTFQYNTIGLFDVELTASNINGSDTEIKYDYIKVMDCEYFTNGFSDWSSVGWYTSTSPSSYDGNSLGCWGGNTSTPITFTLSKSFINVPANSNISFWYKVNSPGAVIPLQLKMNGVTFWTGQNSIGGWINETVSLPQGGSFSLTFESILNGTSSVSLDNICIEP